MRRRNNVDLTLHNVVSTSDTDVVSTLCNVEKSTSDFVSFSTSDQRYFNVDPQRWNNVDPTSKCWLGFKYKFHQQTKFLWEKIKFSKIVWFYLLEIFSLSTIIFLPNFVASNYQKVIADIWIMFASYLFNIGFPLFWSLDQCPPKILDGRLDITQSLCVRWKCIFEVS